MKKILVGLILTFSVATSLAKTDNAADRIRGYIFSDGKNDFITEELNSTFPQTKINWKNADDKKRLCISEISGRCPQYTLRFQKQKNEDGVTVLTAAQVVSALDDPEARLRYYKSLTSPKKSIR
jgi:hypothetical protein